jgi:cell division protein FtsW
MTKLKLQSYDYILLFTPILLSLFGVVMVYSSSMVWAVMEFDGKPDLFFKRQLQWFILSVIAMLFFMKIPYRFYMRLLKLIFFVSPLVLLIVLVAGRTAGNAQSWLSFGFFGFQPSEFIKLGLIIYLAGVFSRKQAYIKHFWPAFGPPLIFTGLIFVLIYVQPDLGTGLLILFIAATITVCAGLRFKHLLMLSALALAGMAILIPSLSTEQMSRFSAAYDPFSAERIQGDGYQLVNSYLAIASGGITGQGLGNSIQKFGYLPEPHTDFILAVIAEELGIFGVGFVLISLACIILKGFRLAIIHPDPFASLLAIGISTMVGIQMFVNVGGLTGLLPITGVPLPFVSYGGSSLLLLMVSMGILNNISLNYNLMKKTKTEGVQPTRPYTDFRA